MKWKVEVMEQWVIYKEPKAVPYPYSVRRFLVDSGEVIPDLDIELAYDLESARELIPPGLYRLERFLDDDPKIVEVWL